ncbi:hypothetical protein F5Y06DRAFT_308624 [Hypoxylon sp. FL0890]|nr:hypothetical protein F5Y06DRAFT_308624 [Hypoxylon sp. FL0890]
MNYESRVDINRDAFLRRFERRPRRHAPETRLNGDFGPSYRPTAVPTPIPRLPSPFYIHPSRYRTPGPPPRPHPRPPPEPAFNPFTPSSYHRRLSYEIPGPHRRPPSEPPPPYTRRWSPPPPYDRTPPGFHAPRNHPGLQLNRGRPVVRVENSPPHAPPFHSPHRGFPHTLPPRQPRQETMPSRTSSGRLSSIPIMPVDLRVRPENMIFRTQYELYERMVSTFRPLVGVIGRIIKEELRLHEQPRVKFDMYPIRTNGRGQDPVIDRQTSSRAPMFKITLPFWYFDMQELQEASDYLKEFLITENPNPWYPQAGYIFRFSRRARTEDRRSRRRFWVPPACIWRFSQSQQCYRAQHIEVVIENVEELDLEEGFRDESDGDQSALFNDMWEEIRRTPYYGPYISSEDPPW